MSLVDVRAGANQDADTARIDKPVQGQVERVLTDSEQLRVTAYGRYGAQTVPVRHPYMGVNSWIRCMPEENTEVFVERCGVPDKRQIFGYISDSLATLLTNSKDRPDTVYRKLTPGELEINSVGRAYTHWNAHGDITMLGGIIEQNLSMTELEHASRAPSFHRKLDQQAPTALAHEERFGVVKRPDMIKPYTVNTYAKVGTAFAVEYGRWLNDADSKALTSVHEGQLFDFGGEQMKQPTTNKPLRYRRLVHHRSSGEMQIDIDEDLNLVVTNSSTAKTTTLDMGSKNEFLLKSKKFGLTISEAGNLTFGKSFTLKAKKISLNAPDVGIGASPVQPIILGTSFNNSLMGPLLGILTAAMTAMIPLAGPAGPAFATFASQLASLVGVMPSTLSTQAKLTA